MKRRLLTTIIIALLIVLLISRFSASYINSDINNLTYVVAIGIDKSNQDGFLQVSFEFTDISSFGSKNSSSSSSKPIIDTVTAPSIDASINLINSYIGKKVELSHCKVIVFSEELAKDSIQDEVGSLINTPSIRPTTNIIVSTSSAKDYIENSISSLEKVLTKYYDIFPNSSQYTGYTSNVILGDFYDDFKDSSIGCTAILGGVNMSSVKEKAKDSSSSSGDSGSSSSTGMETGSNSSDNTNTSSNNTSTTSPQISEVLPQNISAGKSSITGERGTENIGLAVFSDYKYVGNLTALETLCHSILNCEVDTFVYTIEDPKNLGTYIDFNLVKSSPPKIKVNIVDNVPNITIDIKISGRILSLSPNSDYTREDTLNTLSNQVSESLKSNFNDYVNKVSRDYKVDIDSFYKIAKKNFKTTSEWKNFDWKAKFTNSSFNINIDATIVSSSLVSGS